MEKNTKVKEIKRQRQIEALRPEILAKDDKSFYTTKLFFGKDGSVSRSLLMNTPNQETSSLHIEEAVYAVSSGADTGEIKDRFCFDLIDIEVESKEALAFLTAKIYRHGTGKNDKFYIESCEVGKVRDIVAGEDVDESIIFNSDHTIKDGIRVFCDPEVGAVTSSASQLKKNTGTFPGDKDAFARWDKMTFGAATQALNGKEDVSDKGIAQLNARLSQYKAPSVYLKTVGGFAVFMGKETFVDRKGAAPFTTKDEYADGRGFVAAEFTAEAFTAKLNGRYSVLPEAVNGIGLQCRPYLCKLMAIARRRQYIEEYIATHLWECIYIYRDEITPEQQDAYNLAVESKGQSGPYAGKVVVLCETRGKVEIDFFTDLNGLKATFDLTRHSGLNVLDMTHSEHNIEHGSQTSTQLLQTLMLVRPKTTKMWIRRLARHMSNHKYNRLVKSEGHAISATDMGEFLNCANIVSQIAPSFVADVYRPFYKTAVNSLTEGAVGKFSTLNLPTKGAYCKLTTEPGADFGEKFLNILPGGQVEVLCPIAEWNNIKKFIALKYPKMHILEFLKAIVVPVDEYCDRVDASTTLTDTQKFLVKDAARHQSKGLMALPAIEILKNMLAGMDFDGDAAQLYFDKVATVIAWKKNPVAVDKD